MYTVLDYRPDGVDTGRWRNVTPGMEIDYLAMTVSHDFIYHTASCYAIVAASWLVGYLIYRKVKYDLDKITNRRSE